MPSRHGLIDERDLDLHHDDSREVNVMSLAMSEQQSQEEGGRMGLVVVEEDYDEALVNSLP